MLGAGLSDQIGKTAAANKLDLEQMIKDKEMKGIKKQF